MNQEFKNIISEVKYKYKITQGEIAKRLGLTQQYISDVIYERAPFSDSLRDKIENVFFADKNPLRAVEDEVLSYMRKNTYTVGDIASRLAVPTDEVMDTLAGGFNEKSAKDWAKVFGFNERFLLTGEGEVMKGNTVPLIPIEAHAGHLGEFAESALAYQCERVISPVKDAELAVPITGESMYPEYPPGSVVFVKRINEKAFIEWGKAYVLDTTNGAVVKYLAPGKDDGYVKCISANPDPRYAPFEVPLSEVFGIYRIVNLLCTK